MSHKGGLVEETLMFNSQNAENFRGFFLSPCVYLLKSWPSQFLSHWESAEELNFLPFKNQNKSRIFSSGGAKFKCFFHPATFTWKDLTKVLAFRIINQVWHKTNWSKILFKGLIYELFLLLPQENLIISKQNCNWFGLYVCFI